MEHVDLKSIVLAVRPNKEGLEHYDNSIYFVFEETEDKYLIANYKSPRLTVWEKKKFFDLEEAV